MNTKLNLAVAAALLAGASSANAGIMIPAGDWTLDIGGVVNAYYTHTNFDKVKHGAGYGGLLFTQADVGAGDDSRSNITTGLLPNYLSVSGKTRQNDLDVGFTISINPGASTRSAGAQSFQGVGTAAFQENRQAFLTFGDKSWGTIKLGKDLGIYASDAILNDMTLLGVGSGAGGLAGNTTTTGRIGTGFMYADWKSQVAYTSPNWNGFSFTAGVTQAWNAIAVGNSGLDSASSSKRGGSSPAFEGKASYEWAGDFGGKVWVSGMSQRVKGLSNGGVTSTTTPGGFVSTFVIPNTITDTSDRASAWDIGATVNVAGFGLTGYYGNGNGIGQTVQLNHGFDKNGKSRDSDQWYVQGTYTIPGVGTKLGVSYGESTLDGNFVDTFHDLQDSMWTVGAYHPLTKHLNLVAEYSNVRSELDQKVGPTLENKAKTISLGAILFF